MNPTYKHYKEVANALIQLGYTESTINDLQISDIKLNHAEIMLNLRSDTIGIYDFAKHTFVD